MKVFVVEDVKALGVSLKRSIEGWGYSCTLVSDSDKVVKSIQREKPDVIFLDINLVDSDGLSTNGLNLIPKIKEYSDAPIVICTGCGDCNSLSIAKNLGVVDFIVKPINRDRVHMTLKKLEIDLRGKGYYTQYNKRAY
ncbi:Transcriptional regulatory protein BaeR [compost metagenome]